MNRVVAVFMIGATLAGCAPTHVANIGTSAYRETDTERRLSQSAAEVDHILGSSRFRYTNTDLEAYLNRIADRLLAAQKIQADQVEIKVLKDRTYNAFTLPNGTIYFNTGLLAIMESEDQIATILAHELGHVIHRDAYRTNRQLHSASNLYAGLAALPIISILGDVQFVGSIYGYSRDLEREADDLGAKMLVAAGYSMDEGIKVYSKMRDALEAEKDLPPYFFSSHPRMVERITNLKEIQVNVQGSLLAPILAPEQISAVLQPLVHETTVDNLKAADAAFAKRNLQRLQQLANVDPAELNYLQGKLAELEGENAAAIEHFKSAIAQSGHQNAQRDLGLAYLKQGNKDEAKQALQRYLELAPDAQDAAFIKADLQKIL